MKCKLRLVLLSSSLLTALCAAQGARAQSAASIAPLISQPIDETRLVDLPGNTRPEANAANDRGAVPGGMMLHHMNLLLRRSAADEKSAADFVAAQQTRGSPQFHRWLSPEEYGARFGVGQSDLDQIETWLINHGMTVHGVTPSRLVIDFSGTAEQVAQTFHTQIHRLDVAGVSHIANISDPRIPAALAPAVAGVVSLHDFRAASRHHAVQTPTPAYTTGGNYLLVPGDLRIIYNFNSTTTGTGEVIDAVEATDLYSNSDWTTFRSVFGLSKYSAGSLKVVHPSVPGVSCSDPGTTTADDEATLDVEYASAAAPSAEIKLIACASTDTSDGVYLASLAAVNATNPDPVISVSYGVCETLDGATENLMFNKLWQQATAEGISVFVATGDNGPSDCASNGQIGASLGIGANGWGSTSYDTSVGGTDFSDTYSGTNDTYWLATNRADYSSAKSYIPEIPWNSNCASQLLAAYNGYSTTYGASGFCNSSAGASSTSLGGGEGAPSGCATGTPSSSTPGVVSGTCKGTPKPPWQAGLPGIVADKVRDTPDVSLFAANGVWGHAYVICFSDPNNGGGACSGSPSTWAGGGGGTSYATPIWAGIQALVDQAVGAPQGNAAPTLYALAATEYNSSSSLSACNASRSNGPASTCVFYNVTQGDDNSDCVKGSPNCYTPSGKLGVLSLSTTSYSPAFKAGSGYSRAVGLGTVNVTNLLSAWPR